ncbi:MAG: hypothetical protein ACYSUK_05270 [Planctomycetota bacterium]|jgi:hypothetical protein
MKRFIAFLIFACLYNSASALVVLDPNYTAEIYAVYGGSDFGRPWDMTCDPNNNLYISQYGPGVIWKVKPDGSVVKFVTGFNTPRGMNWGGGTSYGDYLCVSSRDGNKVRKITLSGVVLNFASGGNSNSGLEIDRIGNYGGRLYFGTAGSDRLYRVTSGGSVSVFGTFPGQASGGGVYSIAFDPSGDYGGYMFVGTAYSSSSSGKNGLYRVTTGGSGTRFVSGMKNAYGIEFDTIGDFGGYMYAQGSISGVGAGIYRVTPDGEVTLILQGSYSNDLRAFVFGKDGALYVAEHFGNDAKTVVVSRVYYPRFEVALDIKPDSCPNPLNLNSKGNYPVAILGTAEFDVNTIDINTISFADAYPVRSSYEDVSTVAPEPNDCNCINAGPDGYVDLELNFNTQEVVDYLFEEPDDYVKGQVLSLELKGKLLDGKNIVGSDCVVLIGNVPKFVQAKIADLNQDGKVNLKDLAILAEYWLEATEPE